jgi:hypothetical protein
MQLFVIGGSPESNLFADLQNLVQQNEKHYGHNFSIEFVTKFDRFKTCAEEPAIFIINGMPACSPLGYDMQDVLSLIKTKNTESIFAFSKNLHYETVYGFLASIKDFFL